MADLSRHECVHGVYKKLRCCKCENGTLEIRELERKKASLLSEIQLIYHEISRQNRLKR